MPFSERDDDFTGRAAELARALGVTTVVHPIGAAHEALAGGLDPDGLPEVSTERRTIALGNLRSRLRMCLLYLYGNMRNALVVGTGNRDEDYGIGYFTKYGDGGVDISPIADFHKSEVYQFGQALGVPRRILSAPPSAGLWDGQTDEGELGMSYDEIQQASQVLDGEAPELDAPETLTPRQIEVVAKVSRLRRRNRHKLEPPPVYRRRG
jgi:NAD+ synthase